MSHQSYSGGEVLFIATQIEQNGAAAYRRLAQANPGFAALFERLAKDEDEHLRTFARMMDDAGQSGVLHDDEATQAYLSRLAGDYVFPADADPLAPFVAAASVREVLDIAIGLERNSVALYEAMSKAVARDAERELIARIIAEEQDHIASLTEAQSKAQRFSSGEPRPAARRPPSAGVGVG